MDQQPEALKTRIESIQHDMVDVKAMLSKLADAMIQIARMEERQASHSQAMDRAFEAIAQLATQFHKHEEIAEGHFADVERRFTERRASCQVALDTRIRAIEQQQPLSKVINGWVIAIVIGTAGLVGVMAFKHVFESPIVHVQRAKP